MLFLKKNYLLIALFLLLGSFSSGAQEITEKIRLLIREKVSLDSIHRLMKQYHIAVSANVIRKIDAGDSQLIAAYYESGSHSLLLQSDAKGIYLAVINQTNNRDQNKNTLLFQYDSMRLSRFLTTHDSIYQASTPLDLLKGFGVNRYGIACGAGGSPTLLYANMIFLVEKNNVAELRKWLQYPDYETKILGATGLLILQQKKARLSDTDAKQINHLRKLNIPINYCAGCTQWLPVPSGKLLSHKQIALFRDL